MSDKYPQWRQAVLPADSAERKATPICSGVLDYFPLAIAEVARVSKAGNDQHNPGQPLHWARGKSMDHADCLARHLLERGRMDSDGQRHTGKLAWRALALLQTELENEQEMVQSVRMAVDNDLPQDAKDQIEAGWAGKRSK